jgi:hypothetical protein
MESLEEHRGGKMQQEIINQYNANTTLIQFKRNKLSNKKIWKNGPMTPRINFNSQKFDDLII